MQVVDYVVMLARPVKALATDPCPALEGAPATGYNGAMQNNAPPSTTPGQEDVANPVDNRASSKPEAVKPVPPKPVEIGGPSGLEPTRYGDWERNGRVSDF